MIRRTLLAAFSLLALSTLTSCAPQPDPPLNEPPDTVIVDPPDTTEVPDTTPAPAGISIVGLPDTLHLGDEASVTVAVLDSAGEEVGTPPADWDVRITGGISYASYAGLTNVVRASGVGQGSFAATHQPSGLSGEALTTVLDTATAEPPDTTAGQVGEQPTDTVIEIPEPIGEWPNHEPPGMARLVAIDGSTLNWGAGWAPSSPWQNDRRRIDIVVDPQSKYGRAIEKRGFIGDRSNWLGALNVGNRIMNVCEVYIRAVFRLSPNFQFHGSGTNKLLYYGRKIDDQSPTQYFIGLSQSHVAFISQASSPGGTHMGASLASAYWESNGVGGVTRDDYHTIEVVHRMNSAPGVADGYFRMFYDGMEIHDWNRRGTPALNAEILSDTTVEWIDNSGGNVWPDLRFTGGEFFLFWGGQRDTKQVNDWIRLSELYISGR